MAIRETLNRNKPLTMGIAAAIAGLAITYAVLNSQDAAPPGTLYVFFTTDDGKTWFKDVASNVPPFTKDGKEAVRAHVFRCGTGPDFVGYMERNSPEVMAEVKRYKDSNTMPDTPTAMRLAETGVQLKRPGETAWVTRQQLGQEMPSVTCPDGQGTPMPVVP
jgi:hypothetical protein